MMDSLNRGEILAFGLGILLLVLGAGLMFRSRTTRNWHATIGHVVSSRTQWASGSSGTLQFSYGLTYIYRVAGVAYESSRVSLLAKPWLLVGRKEADWFVRRHPSGKEVRVLYDPGDPSRAVLEHRFSFVGLALALLGASILISGVFAIELG